MLATNSICCNFAKAFVTKVQIGKPFYDTISSSRSSAVRSALYVNYFSAQQQKQRTTTTKIKKDVSVLTPLPTSQLQLHTEDFMDMGFADNNDQGVIGKKYSMVELPDSLMETTIFVGNLNDFVTDEILSDLFKQASSLNSVPSVVARKPNYNSLNYGFVTFPTVAEKEAAIIRFHGYTLQGKQIKVEPIKEDGPRVRVPEGLVTYTVGESKKTRGGQTNTLRRISKDDVVRLSRGQPAKKKGYGSRGVCHRLNDEETQAFERAGRSGYVTLQGTGYRRGRKGSPLGNIHRQWCDARAKPQIILCKASGGRPLDNVIIDLSPLRIHANSDDNAVVDSFLSEWKTQILDAAKISGMTLKTEYEEDNTKTIIENDETDIDDSFSLNADCAAWSSYPIWRLQSISMGIFEGERADAKTMAKKLAVLWETMDISAGMQRGGAKNRRDAGGKRGGRTKTKTLGSHRRRS